MANFAESQRCETARDCKNKLTIALKEANETRTWLRFMWMCHMIDDETYNDLYKDIGGIMLELQSDIKECIINETPTEWIECLHNVKG